MTNILTFIPSSFSEIIKRYQDANQVLREKVEELDLVVKETVKTIDDQVKEKQSKKASDPKEPTPKEI